jgi:hypothetical protein
MILAESPGNTMNVQLYDWVPEQFRYLINNPQARLTIRQNFYRKYGNDVAIRNPFIRRIIRCLTRREGLGISELEFMGWEIRREVLNPVVLPLPGGSPWWRNVNLKFIILAQTAAEIVQMKKENDPEINNEVRLWLQFIKRGTPRSWYRAHNASIVRAYLDFIPDAKLETIYEQTFMNEVLYRLLFAQAMVEDDTIFKAIGEFDANPLLPSVDLIVHIPAFYPDHYPLSKDDIQYVMHKGHGVDGDLERDFDDYLIYPHIPALYSIAADWLNIPALRDFQNDGKPIYPNLK